MPVLGLRVWQLFDKGQYLDNDCGYSLMKTNIGALMTMDSTGAISALTV